MITNATKLAATITKWIEPNLQTIATTYLASKPSMRILIPFANYISTNTVTNVVKGFLGRVPDGMLPSMAHSIVDDAIKNGGFEIGNVIFDVKDLNELKTLLNYNLPIEESEEYTVITSPPKKGEEENK